MNRLSSLFCYLVAATLLAPQQLFADVVISEFMASNSGSLADEDGTYSDWIELHNPGAETADLGGFYLTDDLAIPTRWQIPDGVTLAPGQHRIVFASGKDRGTAGEELHTNFSLDADGESLALVAADGITIVSQFDNFPTQKGDISFGIAGQVDTIVAETASLRVLVPGDGDQGTAWTGGAEPFDDSAWTAGSNGVGYDTGDVGAGVLLEGPRPSSDFMFKYEQDVGSHIQDLDLNGTTDFFADDASKLPSLSGGIARFGSGDRYSTDFDNSIIRANFAADDPFTIETRLRVLATGGSEGSRGTLGVFYRDSDSSGAVAYAGRNETGQLIGGGYVTVDTNSNSDAFHTLRLAKASNGDVWVWRDGVLMNPGGTAVLESGVGTNGWGLYLGDTGSTNAGDWELDYVRITPGAFAPGGTELYAEVLATDIEIAMAANSTAYLRLPFTLPNTSPAYDSLRLRARYDDGFIAYLNGTQIATRNAPASPAWNSAASSDRPDTDALEDHVIDIPAGMGSLAPGANVLAVHLLNESTAASRAVGQFVLEAENTSGVSQFFLEPTPNAQNNAGVRGFVGDTAFDMNRGFFTAPFDVAITCATPDAEIFYTTDGSVPSPTNGTLYIAPINISATTPLRAVATKPEFASSNVDTQTYLFLADVLTQDGTGLPTPTNPSVSNWDYEMDPNVVNDPRYSPDFIENLRALPTMSVVLPAEDMWGANGIYNNPTRYGLAWERACSMEMIYPDDPLASFQEDAGIRIQGAGSRFRNLGKKSMRLVFRGLYGAGKLDERFFGPGTPIGFDNIVLRGSYFDSWTVHTPGSGTGIGYNNALQFRTDFGHVTHADMGAHSILRNWSHVYINGIYWGIYNTHERPDENFAELHLGGDDKDYDVLKQRPRGQPNGSPPEVVNGNRDAWNQLMGMMGQNFASSTVYKQALTFIELDQFIDYILLNFYGGNNDWPHNNWYAIRHKPSDGPFIFYNWDPENFLFGVGIDRTGVSTNNSPGIIYDRLRDNAEFRLRFADRIRHHMFHGGALTPTNNAARFQALADLLEGPMTPESARWGDTRTEPPLNTIDDWLPTVTDLLADFFPQRQGYLKTDFRNAGLYPDTGPADFNQHGGAIPSGFDVTMTAPSGSIYYTIDGSDPRLEGGAIHGLPYAGAVTLTENTEILTRVRASNGDWSALTAATFIVDAVPATAANVAISEIHYRPAEATAAEQLDGFSDRDAFEFVEIHNFGTDPIDLTGVRFAGGIFFDFAAHTTLPAGGRLVLVSDEDAFFLRYGAIDIAGEYTGQLNNDGETVTLLAADGSVIHQLSYNDQSPWPTAADGDGYSLVLGEPTSPRSDPESWRSSPDLGGSPGASALAELAGDPNVDEDGDGLSALIEHYLGTSDSDSGAGLSSLRILATGELSVLISPTAAGIDAEIQASTNLDNWSSEGVRYLGEIRNGTQVSRRYQPLAIFPDRYFYRLGVSAR